MQIYVEFDNRFDFFPNFFITWAVVNIEQFVQVILFTISFLG